MSSITVNITYFQIKNFISISDVFVLIFSHYNPTFIKLSSIRCRHIKHLGCDIVGVNVSMLILNSPNLHHLVFCRFIFADPCNVDKLFCFVWFIIFIGHSIKQTRTLNLWLLGSFSASGRVLLFGAYLSFALTLSAAKYACWCAGRLSWCGCWFGRI